MCINEKMKRAVSFLMAVVLAAQYIPLPGFAEEAAGLCEHHAVHENCGYVEAVEGAVCGHEHGADCYRTVCSHTAHGDCGYEEAFAGVACDHQHDDSCGYSEPTEEVPCSCDQAEHTEDCGYVPAAAGSECTHTHGDCSFAEAREEIPCGHDCAAEEACGEKVLNCSHVHDDSCGYAEAVEGKPCGFVCEDCAQKTDTAAADEEIRSGTPDGTPPVLNSITLSAATVTAPGTIAVTVDAADAVSGVSSGEVTFYCADTDMRLDALVNAMRYDDEAEEWIPYADGLMHGNVGIHQYVEAGTFQIQNVSLRDQAGNSVVYGGIDGDYPLPDGVKNLQFDVVESDVSDSTPPVLKYVNLDADAVIAPGTMEVIIEVEGNDEGSPVRAGGVTFYCAATDKRLYLDVDAMYYDETEDKWIPYADALMHGVLELDQSVENGRFRIQDVWLRDMADNSVVYGGVDGDHPLPDAVKNISFKVFNSNMDVTTSLSSADFLETVIDTPEGFRIVADYTGDAILPKEALKALAGTDRTLELISDDIIWRFYVSDTTEVFKDISLKVDVQKVEEDSSDSGEAIEADLKGSPGVIMKFQENGTLPETVTIRLKVDNAMREYLGTGEGLSVYYYNNQTGELELIAEGLKVINDTYVEFPITHGSYYVLTNSNSGGVTVDATNFPDNNFRAWILEQDYGTDGLLSFKDLADVTVIEVPGKNIEDLTGIEHFTALRALNCDQNQLTELDLSSNAGLRSLSCIGNQLTSLNISQHSELRYLKCSWNQLTELNLENNVLLEELWCDENQLTSLDLSNNPNCTSIMAQNNRRTITLNSNKEFSLSDLQGFDVSKADKWNGATVTGNTLTATGSTITYSYRINSTETETFTLQADNYDATSGNPVTQITLIGLDANTYLGQMIGREDNLMLYTVPSDATVDMTFAVSDSSVLEIVDYNDSACWVIAHKPGTVTVTAKDKFTGICTTKEITIVKPKAITVPFEEEIPITSNFVNRYYAFTPTVSGRYVFSSTGCEKPYTDSLNIYIAKGDSGNLAGGYTYPDVDEFQVYADLDAGVTYQVQPQYGGTTVGRTAKFSVNHLDTISSVSEITFQHDDIECEWSVQDRQYSIMANLLPAGSTGKLTWETSDSSIVEISWSDDHSCYFIPRKAGKATITASCGNVSNSVNITVNDPHVLTLDQPVSVTHDKGMTQHIFVFTPTESGRYAFSAGSGGDDYPSGITVHSGKGQIAVERGYGKTTVNGYAQLVSGETYYIGISNCVLGCTVSVTKCSGAPKSLQLRCVDKAADNTQFVLGAWFTPENTYEKIVKWEVSDESILVAMGLRMSNEEVFDIIGRGKVTVTATSESGLTASYTYYAGAEGACDEGHDYDENHVCIHCGAIGGTCGSDLTWSFDEDTGTLTISGTGPMTDWEFLGKKQEAPWDTYRDGIKKIVIEDGVATIGEDAFSRCTNLTEVRIADSVRKIGVGAFAVCKNLTTINIPSGVTVLRDSVFAKCYALTELTIPETVTTIEGLAFSVTGIEAIHIPASVTDISPIAFGAQWCGMGDVGTGINDKLMRITVDADNPSYASDAQYALYTKDMNTLIRCPGGYEGVFTLPDSVTKIGENAFNHCVNVTQIRMGNGVTEIGSDAFVGCEKLNKITLSQGLAALDQYLFHGCESLQEITIPANVTILGSIFNKEICTCRIPLEKIVFEGNAPEFHTGSFYGITATAYYPAGNATWTAAVMQDYEGNITWIPYCVEHSFGEWVTEGDTSCRTCSLCGYTETKVSTDAGDVEIGSPEQTGLHFVVDPVAPSEDAFVLVEEALNNAGGREQSVLGVFDITLQDDDGVAVQPGGKVTVRLPLGSENGGSYKVYRVNDDGTLTDMNAYRQGSHMVFETDHFSLYVIVEEGHSHSWDEGSVTAEATCMAEGVKTFTCTLCGETEERPLTKDPANHTGNNTITGKLEATCGAAGYSGDTVCECGVTVTKGETVPATGKHTGGVATCMQQAVCKVCGQAYGEKDADNHSFTKYVSDRNATCRKDGTKTAKCDYGCGKTDTVRDKGSKLGHNWEGDICKRCGVSRWLPDTGDRILLAVAVLILSGAALLILLIRKKKK